MSHCPNHASCKTRTSGVHGVHDGVSVGAKDGVQGVVNVGVNDDNDGQSSAKKELSHESRWVV